MEFNFTDVLVLEACYLPGKPGEGVSLKSLLGYADYINHDILSWEELNGALNKLSAAGLVELTGDTPHATRQYHEWKQKHYAGKKEPGVRKKMEQVQAFLNASFADTQSSKDVVQISKVVYQQALDSYLDK